MPESTAYNSEAKGVWTVRDAERLTRDSLWPSAVEPIQIELLLIGGGGGGGVGGGGGAGGLIYYGPQSPNTAQYLTIIGTYNISIGLGGTGKQGSGLISNNGQNSVFSGSYNSLNLIAFGGGSGATSSTSNGGGASGTGYKGSNGGSGGGAGGNANVTGNTVSGGSGVSGQGYNGGSMIGEKGCSPSAGGGGAGGAAANVTGGSPTNGGIGLQYNITGSSLYYAGGGGGGSFCAGSAVGGLGGGGNGSANGANATNGTANTGGGGGGNGGSNNGGSGGSGVVIIAYQGSTLSNIDANLVYTLDTTSRPGFNIYKFTSGSGSITI
jgi:hypothetical protein